MKIKSAPLRVDFAGGWLDVPRFAIHGKFIVNCAVSPCVSKKEWPYKQNSGMGGSAAWELLKGNDPISEELKRTGWQDPAIILETGLCIWRSGQSPVLHAKYNPDWLNGLMAIRYTGKTHITAELLQKPRDYRKIAMAADLAVKAVELKDTDLLGSAIIRSYLVQKSEGMDELPSVPDCIGMKYVGSGHGGYALYLFPDITYRDDFVKKTPESLPIEPFFQCCKT